MNKFFREVLLPANGYTVTIRQVDVEALSKAASLDALVDGAEAELSEDVLATLQRLSQSGETGMTPEVLRTVMGVAERVNRQLVQESVVDIDALLVAYRARGTERDFGLGPDLSALLSAIREHNGVPDLPAQTSLQSLTALLGGATDSAPAPKLPKSKAKPRAKR